MPALDSKSLLDRNSTENAQSLCKTVMARTVVKAEECPWVQIGNVYASITVTGEESWIPLVLLLAERGRKSFAVYTGRHGDICNHTDKLGSPSKLIDYKHYLEDDSRLSSNSGSLSGLSIELVDTGSWTHRHSEMLKQDTLAKVKLQKACIYAWCYSLFTFCEAPYEKMDQEYDEATKILRVNASGELKPPSKWDTRLGASLEEEQEAYKTAKLIEQKRVARQNREIASYADRKIFSITGEYWRWA